jgi:nucleoside-diphosphate-sugar epimerase
VPQKSNNFIHISSLVVLGIPDTAPVNEIMPYTIKCFNPYMETKLISEKMVLNYHNQNKLPVTVIRPGILWGLGDTPYSLDLSGWPQGG